MITANQTWLKLAESKESSRRVGWPGFTVLTKLQKSGKAKITQVTFCISNDQEITVKHWTWVQSNELYIPSIKVFPYLQNS